MVFHRCSIFFCRQQGVHYIVWFMLYTSLTTLIAYSIKKVYETYWCSSSIAFQEKRTDWILIIFTFNDKNPLCHRITLILQYLWRSKWSRSNPISHNTIRHIPNITNSEFKLKKCQVFPKPLLFFINFFREYLT